VRAGYWAAGGLPEDGPNASANELGHGADEGELGQNQRRKGKKRKPFAIFKRAHQHLNSNANLNSNKQKQCNSMCATVNSYSSLV
jgi:hypothetical protein